MLILQPVDRADWNFKRKISERLLFLSGIPCLSGLIVTDYD